MKTASHTSAHGSTGSSLFLTSQERHEAGVRAHHGTLDASNPAALLHVLVGAGDEPLLAGALQRFAEEILAYQDAGEGTFESSFSALLYSWAQKVQAFAAIARTQAEASEPPLTDAA